MHKNATQRLLFVTLLLASLISVNVHAQPNLVYQPVITSGLSFPIDIVNAGDGTNRLFVVEQGGAVKVYSSTFVPLGTLVTVDDVFFAGPPDERGLLSVVFHPDYETNRFFYVYYNTVVSGTTYINVARYQTRADNPNLADDSSRKVLMTIAKPFSNHNGGRMLFGPDGNLYFATGDGGSGDDPGNNAQNPLSLLGKMLRIRPLTGDSAYIAPYYSIPGDNPFVSNASYRGEIWSLGLRNPFRWSFDRQTGDMWIGDVGQDQVEEINFRPHGSTGGINYGWACYEGTLNNEADACTAGLTYTNPIYQYPNPNPGAAAVTGGHVYRGSEYPTMQGWYIAADVYSGTHYKIRPNGSGGWTAVTQPGENNIVAFGEAEDGSLYAVNISGTISEVTTNTLVPLRLTYFDAIRKTDHIQVTWKTGFESNLHSFQVEYSLDGRNYQLAQSVSPTNSINGSAYSIQHFLAAGGVVYYRLRIDNRDGSIQYSPVVTTSWDKQVNGAYIPGNVRNNRLLITLYEPFTSLRVLTPQGQTLFVRNIQGMTGMNEITLPELAPGAYIVHLNGKDRQYSGRIVVTR